MCPLYFLGWWLCQTPLLRRMATKAWPADFQNKVSMSKERALKAKRVLSLGSKNQFFTTKAASQSLSKSWIHHKSDPSQSNSLQHIVGSTVQFLPQCTRRWLGLCRALAIVPTKKKLCAVAIPPISFGPAVVGSCAARENEDACAWSVSGLRIIVEGPVGNPWSEERNPDEAKLL